MIRQKLLCNITLTIFLHSSESKILCLNVLFVEFVVMILVHYTWKYLFLYSELIDLHSGSERIAIGYVNTNNN
jgi:hypothetical protein